MDWDDIRYFLALCRANSFVSAAGELQVTHSTVARRITTLEESLQALLFHRTEKGCTLTPAGEKLLPFAEQMESTALGLQEQVSGRNNQLSGSVRIGAPDGLGNCYLASRLSTFQVAHESLDVELIAEPTYYSLSKREVDILVTVMKPAAGNVVARKLTKYKLGLFATREYLAGRTEIKTRKDLKRHRFIGYIDELLFDQELQFMEEIGTGLDVQFRSSTVVAQMNAVLAGVGIGAIPYFMAHPEKALLPVLPQLSIERNYWLQVNPDSRQLARVRTTIDFLVDQVTENRELFLTLPMRNTD